MCYSILTVCPDLPRPVTKSNTDLIPSISHTSKVEQWLMNDLQEQQSAEVSTEVALKGQHHRKSMVVN